MNRSGEGHRRPRRVFIEDVEHDPASQRPAAAALPIAGEMVSGAVEDRRDLGIGQRIDGEQIHEQQAYSGPGRFASASIAPWRIWAAARESTFSARLARLTSA